MNKRAQAYSDNLSATKSASDAAFDHDSSHLAAKKQIAFGTIKRNRNSCKA